MAQRQLAEEIRLPFRGLAFVMEEYLASLSTIKKATIQLIMSLLGGIFGGLFYLGYKKVQRWTKKTKS